MNEIQWLASEDPQGMLEALGGFASDRKLRLWVEACREREMALRPGIPRPYGGHDLDTPDGLRRAVSAWAGPGADVPAGECADLLREIFGNPWRPITLPPAEHLWHDGAEVRSTPILSRHHYATPDVLALAHAAYEVRSDDGTLDPLTPLALADALEEAGCDDWWLLSHLRGEGACPACLAGPGRKRCPHCHEGNVPLRGPHVRGCWAVDLVLGLS